MKRVILSCLLLALIVACSHRVDGQTYEATIQLSTSHDSLNVDLFLRTTSGTSANLGDATFIIIYDNTVLTYRDKNPNLDGRWDNGNSTSYNDVIASNVPPRASLSVTKSGVGTGLDIPTTATRIGRIVFTFTDASATALIAWDAFFTAIYDFSGNSIKAGFTFTNPPSIPLPIQLASSSASVVRDNDVEISWRTVSETNNYGFEIQRRRIHNGIPPQADAPAAQKGLSRLTEWRKVGFVEGNGTTLQPQSYSYIDRSVTFGKYHYRIKQIDLDGKSDVFPEMEVSVGVGPGKFVLGQNYPNPFNPETVIEFTVPKSGRATLKVYNLLGQEVSTLFDGNAEAGEVYAARLVARKLASGVYFYRLVAGSFVEMKKMSLLR